jgi:alpha-beta hydrolase superfamily lysophospholipase
VLQAGDDRVVSAAAAERFFQDMGASDKELVVYPGLYHEILNETSRAEIFSKITTWLFGRI